MKNKKRKIVLIIGIIVLILAIASIVAAVLITKDNSNEKNDNDKIEGEAISFDTENLQTLDDTDCIYLTDKLDSLSGAFANSKALDNITYRVSNYKGYTVCSGAAVIEDKWTIDDFSMVEGYNKVEVTIEYEDGDKETVSKEFYNESPDNFGDVTPDNKADADEDGLTDVYELTDTFTDPEKEDTNDDGVSDADDDLDKDGLTNKEEQDNESNSLAEDTDGDGINDKEEVDINTNPSKEDTDDDGISDKFEMDNDLDPAKPDSNGDGITDGDEIIDIVIDSDKDSDSDNSVELDIDVKGEEAESVSIDKITDNAIINPDELPGMTGDAYDFSMEGSFESAAAVFTFEDGVLEEDVEYSVYYLNEKDVQLEKIETVREDNTLTAKLEHFSVYLILRRDKYSEANAYIRDILDKSLEELSTNDSDNDGFTDDIDPTPLAADVFASYEAYMNYYYSGHNMVSMFVNQPEPHSSEVYSGGNGHSFLAYYDGTDDYYYGYYGQAGTLEIISGATVEGVINMPDRKVIVKDRTRYVEFENPDTESEKGSAWTVAIPFSVENTSYSDLQQFIEDYDKDYNVYTNNCTTFALEAIRYLGVTPLINSCINWDNFILGSIFSEACTPGQAGYCIEVHYKDQAVYWKEYELKDGSTVRGFYSSKSENNALFKNVEWTKDSNVGTNMIDELGEFNGHYYMVFAISPCKEGSWEEAQSYCENAGGYLACITSKEENDFTFNLIRDIYGYNSCYFGLTDKESEGSWKWVNGEKFSYSNWEDGEPNNLYSSGENYGMYYFDDDTWNDGMPEIDQGVFLCEFDKKPTSLNLE